MNKDESVILDQLKVYRVHATLQHYKKGDHLNYNHLFSYNTEIFTKPWLIEEKRRGEGWGLGGREGE